jgi:PAS domain S-box-containing protein
MKKEFQAAKLKLKVLFEQSGTGWMILDPNTSDGIPVIVDANKAAWELHGYTRDDFIGRPVADIDDEEGKRMCLERTQQILSGEPLQIENTHVRKDGTFFPVAVYANRVDIEGELPLIITSEHDITQRKKKEKKLSELTKHQERIDVQLQIEQSNQNSNDGFITKITIVVIISMNDHNFDVKALAERVFMSRSTLQRRIKRESGISAALFIRQIRLAKAHEFIENRIHNTISETAYAVGFKNPGYFSKLYKEYVLTIKDDDTLQI